MLKVEREKERYLAGGENRRTKAKGEEKEGVLSRVQVLGR